MCKFPVCILILLMSIIDVSMADDVVQLADNIQTELPKKIMGKDGSTMVLIPAGEFQMGDALDNMKTSLPTHTVYLDAFYMDIYEVTNAQYRKFIQATGYKEPEGPIDTSFQARFKPWYDKNYNADNQPVVCIMWEDAKAYADWAGKRLPTEAEWEKAARGGLHGKRYPWGNDISYDKANYGGIDGKDIWEYASPVGSFEPNGYGLYDMIGNVGEWCADWWDNEYYTNSPSQNPKGPDSGEFRILRGGSWYYKHPYYLGVASRAFNLAQYGINYHFIGFRCVQDAPK